MFLSAKLLLSKRELVCDTVHEPCSAVGSLFREAFIFGPDSDIKICTFAVENADVNSTQLSKRETTSLGIFLHRKNSKLLKNGAMNFYLFVQDFILLDLIYLLYIFFC